MKKSTDTLRTNNAIFVDAGLDDAGSPANGGFGWVVPRSKLPTLTVFLRSLMIALLGSGGIKRLLQRMTKQTARIFWLLS